MLVLNLVCAALLAASTAQSGIPRYSHGQWILTDENTQYEDVDGLAVEENLWPESPPEVLELVTPVDQNLRTTPEPYVMKEQDSDEGEESASESASASASAVWKIVLIAAILLVSIVGSLSMAYYMCVWRGGRIHYQPQKEGYP